MSKTKAELRNATLSQMGVLEAGETASAEDATHVEEKIDTKHAELVDLGVAYWETSAIPDAVYGALTKIMAYECAPDFMLSLAEMDRMKALEVEGMAALHRHAQARVSDAPVRADYY